MSSSGPAGKKQEILMGVYRQTGETHNNKPVWSRHDGTRKLFYSNGKFKVVMMMGKTELRRSDMIDEKNL